MKFLKLYENFDDNTYDIWDAIDYLSQTTIEKYFKDHYDMSFDSVCESEPDFVWHYVDKEKFLNNIIETHIDEHQYQNKYFLKDYTKADFESFLFDNKEKLKSYIKQKPVGKAIFKDKLWKFITNSSRKELIKIIKEEDLEIEFYKFMLEDEYWNKTVQEIAEAEHGSDFWADTYDLTFMYVDDNKVVDEYIDSMIWDTKFDYVTNDIPYSTELQEEILDSDPKGVMILFDVMEPNTYNEKSLQKNYKFQKAYIKKSNEGNPETLKKLHDKFGLNKKIEKEYKGDLYLVDAEKYNL